LATLEVFQDMIDRPDNTVLKAVTGLEGGCVAGGSTCGIVSNGSLSLALLNEENIKQKGTEAKKDIMLQVGEYVKWFKESYGSFLCRDITKTDFYSIWGQLIYFCTGRRLAGCFWHIRGAMRYLFLMKDKVSNKTPLNDSENKNEQSIHCTQRVLERIRMKTGIGNQRLEELSFIFDGGVGFSGGVCGALVGAITGINLLLGMRVREMSYWKTIKGFAIGHVNLLVKKSLGTPESFLAGKQIIEKFKENAGALECCAITGKNFLGWDDFQNFIAGASQCQKLMDLAVEDASEVILQFK
jgi:hypothetical protein